MYAEKFELLEAKIRETAMLVSRLREEKWHLEQENAQLRERVARLEDDLRRREEPSGYAPHLDSLLQQLDTLQQGTESAAATEPEPEATSRPPLPDKDVQQTEDYSQLGTLYEQKNQFEQAIQAYQQVLEVEPDNLDVTQRLAFLLEKLNRDAEASPLWDKIWAMREAQSTKRRRLR